MFEATKMLFVYVETSLHAGSGRGLGAVDLPIQRERVTHYPMVQGSSIKGRLRAEAREKGTSLADIKALFGPEENASEHAGALSAGDARLLLFPVRSLAGVFAWTTSVDALERFRREAAITNMPVNWPTLTAPGSGEALVNGTTLVAGGKVVLEEFSLAPNQTQAAAVQTIGAWLADNALPQVPEYAYWRKALPEKLCILPENDFRDFVQYATEMQTHIRLKPDTKTVDEGGLWTEESLPVDTLLYAPLMATKSRAGDGRGATEMLSLLTGLNLTRTQLGGDETTGQGMVALRFYGGAV